MRLISCCVWMLSVVAVAAAFVLCCLVAVLGTRLYGFWAGVGVGACCMPLLAAAVKALRLWMEGTDAN